MTVTLQTIREAAGNRWLAAGLMIAVCLVAGAAGTALAQEDAQQQARLKAIEQKEQQQLANYDSLSRDERLSRLGELISEYEAVADDFLAPMPIREEAGKRVAALQSRALAESLPGLESRVQAIVNRETLREFRQLLQHQPDMQAMLREATVLQARYDRATSGHEKLSALSNELRAALLVADSVILVPAQIIQRLRLVGKRYPDTLTAERAIEVLRRYQPFLEDDARKLAHKEARAAHIRAYWDAHRMHYVKAITPQVRIENFSDNYVFYEIKGLDPTWRSDWMGPYVLRPGQSHSLGYPLLLRQLTADGSPSITHLHPGMVFNLGGGAVIEPASPTPVIPPPPDDLP